MATQNTEWMVVADAAIARFLRRPDDAGDELEPVEELTDPAAHARGADLHRDAQGRRAGSAPAGSRRSGGGSARIRGEAGATASAGEGEQDLEARRFARRVAEHLHQALQQRRFDGLVIAAEPQFLGLLRKELTPQVAERVSRSINKDLIHESNRDLADRLAKLD